MNNWKYTLNDEGESQQEQPSQIYITQAGGGDGPPPTNIHVVENTIFFYSDINDQSAATLNRILYEIDCKLHNAKSFFGADFVPHIKLKVNSPGGSLFAALAVVDTIRNLRCEVHTYVEGFAASAGTLLTVVGNKRYIGKHGVMLIHQLSTSTKGTYAEQEDDIENSRLLMKMIKEVYKKYTKVPMKQIDEILKHDLLFDSSKCLELGLVDHVI